MVVTVGIILINVGKRKTIFIMWEQMLKNEENMAVFVLNKNKVTKA